MYKIKKKYFFNQNSKINHVFFLKCKKFNDNKNDSQKSAIWFESGLNVLSDRKFLDRSTHFWVRKQTLCESFFKFKFFCKMYLEKSSVHHISRRKLFLRRLYFLQFLLIEINLSEINWCYKILLWVIKIEQWLTYRILQIFEFRNNYPP